MHAWRQSGVCEGVYGAVDEGGCARGRAFRGRRRTLTPPSSEKNCLAAEPRSGAGAAPGCISLRAKDTAHVRSSGTRAWWNRSRKERRQAASDETHGPRGRHAAFGPEVTGLVSETFGCQRTQ